MPWCYSALSDSVSKVTPYTENSQFDPKIVKNGSVAAAGTCSRP
jgi:hypothetical protein